jgi:hypothetical protein
MTCAKRLGLRYEYRDRRNGIGSTPSRLDLHDRQHPIPQRLRLSRIQEGSRSIPSRSASRVLGIQNLPYQVEPMSTATLDRQTRTFPGSKIRHGTLSGFRRHYQLKERPCPDCYTAGRARQLDRQSDPGWMKRHNELSRAEGRAHAALTRAFPDEFRKLQRKFLRQIERQANDRSQRC